MTVKRLKKILQDAVDLLENYNDNDKVKLVSNTYFLDHPYVFLGIAGYEGGYVDLDNPVDIDDEEEDED